MSATLEWTDEYSVGIPEIDEQHKVLFQLVNQLSEAIHQRHGSEACQGILAQLVEYTRIHFALEESLMRMANYLGFDEHKHLHEQLISDVVTLNQKMESGKAKISFELLHFLRVWLTKHILHSDKEYAAYFKREGFGAFKKRRAEPAPVEEKTAWWKFW
jgi:hemerythrin